MVRELGHKKVYNGPKDDEVLTNVAELVIKIPREVTEETQEDTAEEYIAAIEHIRKAQERIGKYHTIIGFLTNTWTLIM